MVKGIINAFDHMELCFVINMTKYGNWAINGHQYLLLGMLVLLLPFLYQVASTCCMQKKLISNTEFIDKLIFYLACY